MGAAMDAYRAQSRSERTAQLSDDDIDALIDKAIAAQGDPVTPPVKEDGWAAFGRHINAFPLPFDAKTLARKPDHLSREIAKWEAYRDARSQASEAPQTRSTPQTRSATPNPDTSPPAWARELAVKIQQILEKSPAANSTSAKSNGSPALGSVAEFARGLLQLAETSESLKAKNDELAAELERRPKPTPAGAKGDFRIDRDMGGQLSHIRGPGFTAAVVGSDGGGRPLTLQVDKGGKRYELQLERDGHGTLAGFKFK